MSNGDGQQSAADERENYLNKHYGIGSWLFTTDHKRIALLYLISITFFFFIGGFFALLIRLELLTPAGDLVQADTYNKLFTMHGMVMVFFFLIPSIPAVLGNFLVPMMIGAKDLAFPAHQPAELVSLHHRRRDDAALHADRRRRYRLDLLHALQHGLHATRKLIEAGLAIFVCGFSSILTGLNFVVTIHRMRAPGMTWSRLPLFIWAHYATSIIQILGTPVIAITLRAGRGRTRAASRHLRSQAGRRSAALPASVLVLLAPGRLHHDSAVDGHHQRDHRLLLAQAHLRLHLRRASRRSPSPSSDFWSGRTTCSSPGSPSMPRSFSRC